MIYEVYNFKNDPCELKQADAVFAVFEPNTTKRLDFQHVAIYYNKKAVSISIRSVNDTISVLEFIKRPQQGIWPNLKEGYQVQVVGQMIIDGADLRLRIKNRIIEVGKQIEIWAELLLKDNRKNCGWSPTRYKYIKHNPNDPEIVEEIRFTCSGFVEHCYEEAGVDIVLDNPVGERSPLPLVPHPDRPEGLIHRLFPGYQIKAFKDDKYPLNFDEMRKAGKNPEDFQYYPF